MVISSSQEKRRESRRRVYLGEGIKITLKGKSEQHVFTGEATDISPWGIAVVIQDQKLFIYPKSGDTLVVIYSNKDKIIGSAKAQVVSVVRIHRRGEELIRFGLEFVNDYLLNNLGKEEKRCYTPIDLFAPHAWCSDPFFFQEKIVFRILAFQADGFKFITSARNKSFLPNIFLNLKVYLPMQGEFEVLVKILATEVPPESQHPGRYIVIAQFVNPTATFLQAMVEYILFCGIDVTPQELRREKLPVNVIEKSLSFYYATSQKDLDMVIHLRQTCLFDELGVINSDSFAVQDELLVENYSFGFDTYDETSRQIVCKMGAKSIACVRIIFNNRDQNKCEIAASVEKLPDWLWSKRFVEISRLAWENEYRESDVFINLVRHIIRIAVESGHSHLLTSAPPALKQLYLKVGFQPLALTWKNNVDEKKRKEFPMLLDAKRILMGELIIDKGVWSKIYAPVARHLGLIKI